MRVKEILDGIELVAARLRIWLAGVLTLLVGFEALYASGQLDSFIPPGSKWAKWLPVAALLVARYTHGKASANALIDAKAQADANKPE